MKINEPIEIYLFFINTYISNLKKKESYFDTNRYKVAMEFKTYALSLIVEETVANKFDKNAIDAQVKKLLDFAGKILNDDRVVNEIKEYLFSAITDVEMKFNEMIRKNIRPT